MDAQIRYARRADGARTAYAVSGSGPVMVYTPGFTSHLEWALHIHAGDPRFREELAKRRTLVDYDRHGCGLSDRNRTNFTAEDDMLDIEAVVDAAGAAKIDLFGISFGSLPAVRYAAEHPERVRKLILWGAFPFNLPDSAPPEIQARNRALAELRRSDYVMAMRTMATQMFPSGVDPETFRHFVDVGRQSATPEMLERLGEVTFDNRPYFARVTAPTLVMHRRADAMVPFVAAQYLARELPNARFVPLEGDAHLPNFGDVDSVLAPILQFLDEDGDIVAVVAPPVSVTAAPAAHGTVVILFTDIVDSTPLTERMGDAAFRAASRALDAHVREAMRDAGGAPVEGKVLGDGVMGVFASAAQAITCAVRCVELSRTSEMPLHIGLHAGDVIREKDNVYGGAVNIAGRVCGLSAPGEVLVSQTVRDLARTSAGVTFEDRGEQALKGIADPVRVFAVRTADA
jgi:class 3 adenylate cyclase/pimeloyl-ACP methyl ester carboxylesterase